MKTKNTATILKTATALLLLALPLAASAATKELTAFELIKEGNRYVGEHVRDKVVQVRSEKSVGGLTPTIWYVVYYDTTASLKAMEVKFGAGKMLDVKRPMRVLEQTHGGDIPLDRAKLKINSDAAIATALKEPLLEKLTITATSLKCDRLRDGTIAWRVRLWAAKLRNPNKDVDIGDVQINAEDGKVLRTDIHINRVD
ncbi:MAG TPA: hypothetical protein VK850_00490 [Candidatus Binatia bacterium]|nr:hypothetical protein [Candidatus Binatia bacterium]